MNQSAWHDSVASHSPFSTTNRSWCFVVVRSRFVLAALSIAFCSFTLRTICGDEPVKTLDFLTACKTAAQTNKIVVVVEFADNFTTDPFLNLSSKIYRITVLQDLAVKRELDEGVQLVVRNVGAHGPRFAKVAGAVPGDSPVAYFCTPDGGTLHFLVGFPSAERFLQELQWAQRIWVDGRLKANDEVKLAAVRRWHLDRVVLEHVDRFKEAYSGSASRDSAREDKADADIGRIVTAANAVRHLEFKRRLPAQWNAQSADPLTKIVATHGDVVTDFPHFILSASPYVSIETLAPHVVLAVNGTDYFQFSPRRETLRKKFEELAANGTPALVMVQENTPREKLDGHPVTETSWQAKDERLRGIVDKIAVLKVSLSEFQAWTADAKCVIPEGMLVVPPSFVFVNERGQPVSMLAGRATESQIVKELMARFPSVVKPILASSPR